MITTIESTKKVKARINHACSWCGMAITKGEKYETSLLKNDGDVYRWKSHIRCIKLVSSVNIEYDGDGITQEDFNEYVLGEYCNITGSHNQWINFTDAIDAVCSKYLNTE